MRPFRLIHRNRLYRVSDGVRVSDEVRVLDEVRVSDEVRVVVT